MNLWALALTAFLGSAVEAAEAVTIVLAVGTAYDWRSALLGAAYASLALVVLVGAGGAVLLALIPIRIIQIVVGAFLIWFAYGWLRKSVLRFAGQLARKDEAAAYERRVTSLRERRHERGGLQVAFSGVFLEGLEVAIIVVTVGSASAVALQIAGISAVVAVVLVGSIAALLRTPFSHIPENEMKFVVGTMLATFGIFWFGEGVGLAWWHDELSLALIAAVVLLITGSAVLFLRRTRAQALTRSH